MKKVFVTVVALLLCLGTNAQSWQYVGNTGIPSSSYSNIFITIGNNNVPYIINAGIMKFNGTTWNYIGNSNYILSGSTNFGGSMENALAVDNNEMPYIAYIHHGYGYSNQASVMSCDTALSYIGDYDFSDSNAYHLSFAIDGNNTPYVSYDVNYNEIVVMKYNGSSWVNVGSPISNVSSTSNNSLVIDAYGTLYICGVDINDSNKAIVMKYDGNEWSNVGNTDFSVGGVDGIVLALDKDG